MRKFNFYIFHGEIYDDGAEASKQMQEVAAAMVDGDKLHIAAVYTDEDTDKTIIRKCHYEVKDGQAVSCNVFEEEEE